MGALHRNKGENEAESRPVVQALGLEGEEENKQHSEGPFGHQLDAWKLPRAENGQG